MRKIKDRDLYIVNVQLPELENVEQDADALSVVTDNLLVFLSGDFTFDVIFSSRLSEKAVIWN